MSEETFDHDFDAEDACDICGMDEESDNHNEDDEEYFEHEFEQSEACSICGMDEGDLAHQEEG